MNVPIFYACDDNFVKYTLVSIRSMIENASKEHTYSIHILITDVSDEMRGFAKDMENERFTITFDDVSAYLKSLEGRLPIRDYYSKTTYFRIFIAEMYPELDKAIYIDSDTVVLGDISELYAVDIKDNYVGACNEQAMIQVDTYGTYAEQVVGIDRRNFFNAGMLLINCEQFRKNKVLDQFAKLLGEYNFVVTQDEDYLNLICKDKVHWLHPGWNTEVFGVLPVPESEMKIIHYIMVSKPWHYDDCRLQNYFWKYAEMTPVAERIYREREEYTDEEKQRDTQVLFRLEETARKETEREDNYLKTLKKKRSGDRELVLKRIAQYEREGKFDCDVEEDPPSRVLHADEVDYLQKKPFAKFKAKLAFRAAGKFVDKLIDEHKFILKEYVGIENFANLASGAVITCNHFNAFDSFAIHLAYYASGHKKRRFYRVIKEGNYTSYPGFYGYLMRRCNTLPLSSDFETMKKFVAATDQLLKEGNFVLFYPEQSMWWNYRKPKPLKDGAFKFAAKNGVPVLPCFITMQDSAYLDDNGYPVQEYTVHIGEPIYPDPELSVSKNTEMMKAENFRVWKQIYEDFYFLPLEYAAK